MTSEPKIITVECPACGHHYEDSYRPSINLRIEHFDNEYLERISTATCPSCHCTAQLGTWISNGKGQITVQIPQARFKSKEDPPIYWVRLDRIAPEDRITVMKILRSFTSLNLNAARTLIENLPQTVLEHHDREEAEKLKGILEEARAQVTLRRF